jgi:hypothetical protein
LEYLHIVHKGGAGTGAAAWHGSVFVFLRKYFFAFCKKSSQKVAKIFFFAKIFHLECGYGSRIRIQDTYPAPKHWWMVPKNQLKKIVFGGRLREQNDCKNIGKNKIFCKNENFS